MIEVSLFVFALSQLLPEIALSSSLYRLFPIYNMHTKMMFSTFDKWNKWPPHPWLCKKIYPPQKKKISKTQFPIQVWKYKERYSTILPSQTNFFSFLFFEARTEFSSLYFFLPGRHIKSRWLPIEFRMLGHILIPQFV